MEKLNQAKEILYKKLFAANKTKNVELIKQVLADLDRVYNAMAMANCFKG